MKLEEIYKPVEKKLLKVESRLQSTFENLDNNFISTIGRYVVKSPGKRLRPALVILSSSLGHIDSSDKIIDLAASIELVHTATLVHDDVIDNAKIRRRQPAVNVKFGNDAAILFGDYLYSLAFSLISSIKSSKITEILLKTTKGICHGEMQQLYKISSPKMKPQEYLKIISDKTAFLFSACCETGGIMGGVKGKRLKALRKYGYNLGISFQIMDDCLDIIGDEKIAGKTVALDEKCGKITFPLIYFNKAKNKTLAVKKAWEKAKDFGEKALKEISPIEEGNVKQSLKCLVSYILKQGGEKTKIIMA